ncbi:unnamed protein product [Lathyrus sativus]|nr:unnamed protein product [Lathyrus sativus]
MTLLNHDFSPHDLVHKSCVASVMLRTVWQGTNLSIRLVKVFHVDHDKLVVLRGGLLKFTVRGLFGVWSCLV